MDVDDFIKKIGKAERDVLARPKETQLASSSSSPTSSVSSSSSSSSVSPPDSTAPKPSGGRQIFYVPFNAQEDRADADQKTLYDLAKEHRDVISARVFVMELQKVQMQKELERPLASKTVDDKRPAQSANSSLGVSSSRDKSSDDLDDGLWVEESETEIDLSVYAGLNMADAHDDVNYLREQGKTLDELWGMYEGLPKNDQVAVMSRVKEKTPVLVRCGEQLAVGPEDVVNVVAHGSRGQNFIEGASWTETEKTPAGDHSEEADKHGVVRREKPDGTTGRVSTSLNAAQLVKRMETDLGGGAQKIKLSSCGSRTQFLPAVHEHCSQEGARHFDGARISGYDGDAIVMHDTATAMWNLDQGLRKTMPVEDYRANKKARQEFNQAQENLEALLKQAEAQVEKFFNASSPEQEEEINKAAQETKKDFQEKKTIRDEKLTEWQKLNRDPAVPAKQVRLDGKVGEQGFTWKAKAESVPSPKRGV